MIEIYDDGGISKKLKIPFTPKYIKSIDGEEVLDVFDIFYKTSEEKVLVEFLSSGGENKKVKIDAGLLTQFNYESIKPKKCGCKCIFCFIDQLPKGLRKSLYHKDEDYRFSYLYGNYVTLANISRSDIERIIRYKLTPLYVSVHSTDEEIRKLMLGRKKLIPILDILRELAEGGIKFHCQIVLCPDINDGGILEKTIKDLASLSYAIDTVAVVPVGLTKHRGGLFKIRKVNKKDAEKAFNIITKLQEGFKKDLKRPLVYLSDEFYLILKKEIPSKSFYKGFPQYENGVGIIRKFIDNAERLLKKDLPSFDKRLKVAVVTGELAYEVVSPYIKKLADKINFNIDLVPIKNFFFGDSVTVTGLVVGIDIINALKGKEYDVVLVPNIMLRDRENFFLDDLTLKDISLKLKAEVLDFDPTLSGLYNKIKRLGV